MDAKSQVHLARTENYPGTKLLHGFIQSQLNSTMVFDPTKLWPGRFFATKHGLAHKLTRRVGKHSRKVCIRYLRKYGDVPRVFLA